jgi:hypothetical protein
LRAAPHFDLEARSHKRVVQVDADGSEMGKWLAVQGGIANDMRADFRGQISPYSINRLIVVASLDGSTLTRLAVRRAVPNLEVQYLLPNFDQVSSPRMLTSIRQLSEEVLKV